MLSIKENYLETIKQGGKPDRAVVQWGPIFPIMGDPCHVFTRGMREKGKTVIDRWGVTIAWPEDQPAAVPHVTPENKVLKDVTKWREQIKIPDVEAAANATVAAAGWEDVRQRSEVARKDPNLGMAAAFMGTGMFEQMHALMGFEDALMAFLMEPEATHELLDAICDFRCTYAKLIIDNWKPDVVISHDDWGSKTSLFMHPDTWREFFKERYRKFYKLWRDAGVLALHHADCYCEPIAEDMADIGIEVWQGVVPQNDIPAIQKKLGGRMGLMGGIDNAIVDIETVPEEVIRAHVREGCDRYLPGGNFIINLPTGMRNGSLFPRIDPIIDDEITKYAGKYFK